MTATRIVRPATLAVGAVTVWALAAAFLWRTKVPADLRLPALDAHKVFGAGVVEDGTRFDRFFEIEWIVATLTTIAVLVVLAPTRDPAAELGLDRVRALGRPARRDVRHDARVRCPAAPREAVRAQLVDRRRARGLCAGDHLAARTSVPAADRDPLRAFAASRGADRDPRATRARRTPDGAGRADEARNDGGERVHDGHRPEPRDLHLGHDAGRSLHTRRGPLRGRPRARPPRPLAHLERHRLGRA